MSKKVIYKTTLFVVDIIAMIAIYLFSPIINNDLGLYELTKEIFFTSMSFVAIQMIVFSLFGCYNLLWMYRSYRNYYKMLIALFCSNLLILIFWVIYQSIDLQTLRFGSMTIAMLLFFVYIYASRFLVR